MIKLNSFEQCGVDVELRANIKSKEVDIVYDGLLAKSGAESVYVHVGHESDKYSQKDWDDIKDIKMYKCDSGHFRATVPVDEDAGKIAFAFRDSADNWDNNSGKNYCICTNSQEL